MEKGTGSRRALPPFDPVEFLGRLCVVLCVLSPYWKAHGMSPSHIASNHPLVGNILSNLLPQVRLNLQVPQGIVSSLGVR